MPALNIEQLDEGYLIQDDSGKKSAVASGEQLIRKIRVHFGLIKTGLEKNFKKPDAEKKPETLRNDSPPAREPSATAEKTVECPASLEGVVKKVMDKSVVETGPANILQPKDLKLSAFEFDRTKMQQYRTIFFLELPDGRVVLEYGNSHYYTTKEKVLQIPFPIPRKYFNKENGWSSSVEMAFKSYRRYLAEQQQQQQVEKEKTIPQKQEDPDDWKYKSILKTDTKGSHGEDYEKIEGALEV